MLSYLIIFLIPDETRALDFTHHVGHWNRLISRAANLSGVLSHETGQQICDSLIS